VRLCRRVLWPECFMDEKIRPTRVLDDCSTRTRISGEDRNSTCLGDAETYTLHAMVY
jgi:hypothetical protein